MTSRSFFLSGAAPDPAYRNVRDLKTDPFPKARAFVEELWQRYRGLEDRHFLSDARTHFLERFWEMYLAVTLIDRDLTPMRHGGQGPEFSCQHLGQKMWFEAVVPGAGTGDDGVERPAIGTATYVPSEKILLRFTGAMTEKRKRYLAARERGAVADQDRYILAINSRAVPHAPYGGTLPFFVQAFLPIGAPTMVISRATGEMIDSYYARRETIVKASGASVSTTAFLDPQFSFVSAVIHSGVDCVNRPAVLGDDFVVLHNPTAARPIDRSLFRWCTQYLFEDDELRVLRAG